MSIDILLNSVVSTPISINELHLWLIRDQTIDNDRTLKRFSRIISIEERLKQKNFYFKKHRQQYLITRALLRYVLSKYENTVSPSDWVFISNKYGRPYIANKEVPQKLFFNLSHTDNCIALLVSHEEIAGIDVEWVLRKGENLGIAERYFSLREVNDMFSLPDKVSRVARFYDLWTLKEAYIKARGMGLSIPLDSFSFLFNGTEEIDISFSYGIDDEPINWSFWQLIPYKDYKLSIALRRKHKVSDYRIIFREIDSECHIKERCFPLLRYSAFGKNAFKEIGSPTI
ncbi:4'-phosphopantetheinyl transferase superfamily protein [Microbulbifer sp. 2205BS26-8]|uniref:4'-phosphopantetheinyl transferase family protein n=1 Tax=Microbulbifer sp. 2205BS26-8 TaxID=3064386 RepID=UPI00273F8338|nr:4'-phosphopantetheinyl transferase superfamily protein [Microbulbifer sp. 2205BS26-8]MDP5210196.1 4'-phosphopantetheinyl transferase superfamily protein [Microbulbifer sp. 2205BS26-8]